MTDAKISRLRAQRTSLLAEFVKRPGFIRGSLIRTSRSGRDGTRREFSFLSRRVAGINHSTYVTSRQREAFAEATALYRRTSALIEKICAINIQMIRSGGTL